MAPDPSLEGFTLSSQYFRPVYVAQVFNPEKVGHNISKQDAIRINVKYVRMRSSTLQNEYQGIIKVELRTKWTSRIEFSYLLLKDFLKNIQK